ncbi:amino acid adenylation domain-containing protein [Myxococcus sp. K38C18041901]|uniref:amino acid adenylation domain-containing protein n=1 Tax=Myxococcus guangdongensis TaxID=2906760 RepID=UPI0020A74A2F|nr:amino acid adenylation domain-containing protein [Myxococcus guangdongensis]MCP3061448.1 amino acid adenylation domain-containing protein [Myxococcus guangdongensis]
MSDITIRLPRAHDVARAQAALRLLEGEGRLPTQGDGKASHAWVPLPSRAQTSTEGNGGLDASAETSLIALLEGLDAPTRAVRLLTLFPGGPSVLPADEALEEGWLRLHLPLRVPPGADVLIDGLRCDWKEGALCHGGPARPLVSHHQGSVPRVHLVFEVRAETALAPRVEEEACLPDLLLEQARHQPDDAVAVVYGHEQLTFQALVERATGLAARLGHAGVGPDDCVGLFVEPSVELMVGAWGILFAGAAYLPLAPEYPEERLRFMLEHSRAQVVFTQPHLTARLAELAPHGTRILTLQQGAEAPTPRAGPSTSAVRPPGLGPHHLAYVIYTSGSTGRPKGVMIEQRSIVSQMRWLSSAHGLGADKVVLQKTPMSFDAAQWELLAPCRGARVVMGGPGVYREPERLLELISTHQVTTLQCVPTLLQALIDTEGLHRCASLTQVFSGGEALSKGLAHQCLTALPRCTLVNLYGPTECTINSSSFTVDPATLQAGPNTLSIGAPVHGTRYHILDAGLSPVGPGEQGELYIGGIQLARGYLHQPDLTAQRFVDDPFPSEEGRARLYRTGDLATWNPDGTVQFAGRADNQVKLRGFRVELDEIRLAIETHDWVKHAAVIIKDNPHTGFQNLIAYLELNPKEAALMDQGNHGAHHQSKQSKLQVKAQLSNPGCREPRELLGRPVVELPGREPTERQRREVFARKTYRFFEGGAVSEADVLRLLGGRAPPAPSRAVESLDLRALGELLRYFGQFPSEERLLPKYAYASPGALYATQLYLELSGFGELPPGCYYYHPLHHQLVLVRQRPASDAPRVSLHWLGKQRAIEPTYKNNIQEVLEIEAGHMVGLLEEVLPRHGLGLRELPFTPGTRTLLDCADSDVYLGSFELVSAADGGLEEAVDLYVQPHPGKVMGLPPGQYHYQQGMLKKVSDELIQKRHVIAINQQVYERASLGITVVSRTQRTWRQYIDLGRKLHQLQANEHHLGFMSSGYSSHSGHDLPSARRMDALLRGLGHPTGPSYFFVGGRVSEEQRLSEGMKEDVVHMQGPAEMIREDLLRTLPDYMMPNRVIVLDALPLTANGKLDLKALERRDVELVERPFVAPRTPTEERVAGLWRQEMKREAISVQDDFFELGGNSLLAVGIINKLNRLFQTTLPLQVLFEASTVEQLARKVEARDAQPASRLVHLRERRQRRPIYCWPGLGGYTMNLQLLASRMGTERLFYGVQAHGINPGETPYATLARMAQEDLTAIRRIQPRGPYTLWGYSFGARVAFEAAWQLEQAGEQVEHLFLIAPGSPRVRARDTAAHGSEPGFANPAYVSILFSVFAGSITDPALTECLEVSRDEDSFVGFICGRLTRLEPDLVRRIIRIVQQTFEFQYSFRELLDRKLQAAVTLFKAQGDDYSFIENSSGYSARPPTVVQLEADHYSLLREPDIDELVRRLHHRLWLDEQLEHHAA